MRIRCTGEQLGLVAPLATNLQHLRVQHEVLPPGRRSSRRTHTRSAKRWCTCWTGRPISGSHPGDVVSFAVATGIAHTLINNMERDAVLFVVATMPAEDACFYPHDPTAGNVPQELAREWTARPRDLHPGTAPRGPGTMPCQD